MLEKIISMVLLSGNLLSGALYDVVPQKDIKGDIFLVNRDYPICESFTPVLEDAKVQGTLRLQQADSARALEEMFAAAKEEKINLLAISGYRSYSKQDRIYEKKTKKVGEEKANEYVAKPGTSEHQLGLAMDLGEKNVHTSLTESFANTKAGIWLVDNAHRFGFIVRYQKNWEEITGYLYEPWHVRYVGIDHASAMYKENIPMEEYVQKVQMNEMRRLLAFEGEMVPMVAKTTQGSEVAQEPPKNQPDEKEEGLNNTGDDIDSAQAEEILFQDGGN